MIEYSRKIRDKGGVVIGMHTVFTPSMAKEKYMIDGAVKDLGGWACMCAACFQDRGRKIAWGHGQLYLQEKNRWLEVAGFPPEESGDDAI